MKIFLQITMVMFLISCSVNKKQETADVGLLVQEPEMIEEKLNVIDTVLAYNAPEFVDSSRHQLFIDTTKSSKYYKEIIDWKPNKFDNQAVEYYFKEISETFDATTVDLKQFPRDWISIYSLDNEFVAYNPINGIDWRFSLTDSSVNHYRMEADTEAISKVISLSQDELILELRTIKQNTKDQISFIKIKKTKHSYIYVFQRLEYLGFNENDYSNLITPLESLINYNLVVSDAPNLVHSIVQFDKADKSKLE